MRRPIRWDEWQEVSPTSFCFHHIIINRCKRGELQAIILNKMGRFSKEWLINECVVKDHCLGVELANGIQHDGKKTRRVYVKNVLAEDEADREAMIECLLQGRNTYHGHLAVECFADNPVKTFRLNLNLDDILSVSTAK